MDVPVNRIKINGLLPGIYLIRITEDDKARGFNIYLND